MKRIAVFVSLMAVTSFVSGCCGGGADKAFEESLDAAFDEALQEMEKELEAAPVAEGGGEAADGNPCSAYSKCCSDYIGALSNLDGYPADAVEAAKAGCDAAETYKNSPGMEETCTTMLDAMKQGMAGMSAYPGWKTPGSCE